MTQDTAAILVCGGSSTRMGINKILFPLGNTTVAGWSMLAFERCDSICELIVVARRCDWDAISDTAKQLGISKLRGMTEGGETRQKSVINGLKEVSANAQYIAIHDGARPLVRPEDIEHVIADARVFGAATLGVPVKDTIKVVEDGLITETPYRPSLYITQTPQVFRKRLYLEGVDFALEHDLDFTDDCQLVEALGTRVYMTAGSYSNLKLTTPEDLRIAEVLWKEASAL